MPDILAALAILGSLLALAGAAFLLATVWAPQPRSHHARQNAKRRAARAARRA